MSAAGSSKPAVVVVENEPVLLTLAAIIVEDAGFEAIRANNADAAIEVLQTRGDVRIVFTEIELPGSMDGIRLVATIRDRWPPIELILTSAYPIVPVEDIPERGRFFAKPYRPAEIVEALHQMAA